MDDRITVDDRVEERHPELSPADVESALRNAIEAAVRLGEDLPVPLIVAVGSDANNRLIEVVGATGADGSVHVFHAMTPPSKKTMRELGLE